MKKLQELIMKDVGWKLLSLAIAIVLWFMVINIEHPVTTRIYTQTISLENMDTLTEQGLTVLNEQQLENMKVSAKIKAQRTSLDKLTQYKDSIKAVIDLKKLYHVKSGDMVLADISFVLPEEVGTGFEIISQSPEKAEVLVERLATKKLPIKVRTTGEAGSGYTTLQPQISPDSIQIAGAASVVNQVESVQVIVDLQQASEDIVITASPVAYDKEGKLVEGITMDISKVHVSVGVQKNKKVDVVAQTQGIPAQGYEISEVVCTPKTVTIAGSKTAVEQLDKITLPPVDVTEAKSTVTEYILLNEVLPEGVMLGNNIPIQAEVSVVIQQQEEQQITVESGQITLNGTDETKYHYTLSQESVSLTLSGQGGQLADIITGSIAVIADVTDLKAGEHTIALEIDLPEGVTLIGDTPSVMVEVAEKQGEQEMENQPILGETELEENATTQQPSVEEENMVSSENE